MGRLVQQQCSWSLPPARWSALHWGGGRVSDAGCRSSVSTSPQQQHRHQRWGPATPPQHQQPATSTAATVATATSTTAIAAAASATVARVVAVWRSALSAGRASSVACTETWSPLCRLCSVRGHRSRGHWHWCSSQHWYTRLEWMIAIWPQLGFIFVEYLSFLFSCTC